MSPVYQPPASGSGSVATDAIWTTKGDIAAATGSAAAVRVGVGANGKKLLAASGQTAGLLWAPDDTAADVIRGSNAIIRETIPAFAIRDSNVALATGVMLSIGIVLYAGDVITNIAMRSGGTAAGTPTHWWFAMYSNAATPALLSQTTDQTTTAWAAGTIKDLALGAAQTITTTDLYWFSVMMAATTPVSLCGNQAVSDVALNGIVSGMKQRCVKSGAALTTTAPATITSVTTDINMAYIVGH